MAKKEPLFELIKSMSQTEKRYFKRFSTLQKGTESANYVQLFSVIEKLKEYDEERIIKQFTTPYLAQQKRHLYLKLMESLRSYHSERTIDSEINSLLNDYHILLNRSLNNQASKVLRKAKAIAVKYERYSDIIKITKLESEYLWAENNISAIEVQIKEYKKTTQNVVKLIENQILYEKEYLNIIKWNKQIEFIRNKKELSELANIIQQPIFKDESIAISFAAKSHFYYIKGLYHFFLSEFELSESYFAKQLLFLENNPSLIKDDLTIYIRAIGNYILLNLKLKKFKNYNTGISKLNAVKIIDIQVQYYAAYILYVCNLIYLNKTNDFKRSVIHIEKNREQIQVIEEWIDKKNIMRIEKNYVMFNSITAYINTGELKMALNTMNVYLNNVETNFKEDCYCIAIILNLFIHFELNNIDLLEYNLKSVYRFLKTRNRIYEFEKLIMKFITKVLKLNNNNALKKEFIILRDQLIKLQNNKFEKNVFEYFDFVRWLDQKLA